MRHIKLVSLIPVFIFLLSVFCCCKDAPVLSTGEYEGSTEESEAVGPLTSIKALRNPERGYNLESNYFAHNLKNPGNNISFPDLWVDYMATVNNALSDSLTLTQLNFYLTEFVGTNISQEAFDNMQTVLDDAKNRGYKVNILFAYDHYPNATNATFNDVFRHLAQLNPFIAKNIGIIDLWRMGFIGAWGEGHTSPMRDDWTNKAKLVKGILDAFPERFMALRYPTDLERLMTNGLSAEYARRVGYTNDYFTASEHPLAPDNDYTFNSPAYAQVEEKSPYVKVVGEIPYDEDTEWGLHFNISVPNSIRALKEHHYSAFDITQNNALNFANWKGYQLTPSALYVRNVLFDDSYFRNDEGKLVARSAYQFVRDHLGYRLYVDFNKTTLEAGGGQLNYDITVYNTGFSTILNPRPVKLVLVDAQRNLSQIVDLNDIDPRDWQPHDPQRKNYKQIYHNIKGSATVSLSGKYKVGLWLPDPTDALKDVNVFSIIFANTEIIQTAQYRINVIGEVNF